MTDAPMSTRHPFRAELSRCNRELDERLRKRHRFMNIRRYRVLKIILAFVVMIGSAYAISEGGDPTIIMGLALIVAGALAGLEMTELLETYQTGKQAREEDSD